MAGKATAGALVCERVTMTFDKQHCQHIGISGTVETSSVESVTEGVNDSNHYCELRVLLMCQYVESDCYITLQCLYPRSVVFL